MLDLDSMHIAGDAAFTPRPMVEGQSLSEQVYGQLRGAIVKGQFKPETAILEPQIAKQFGISRTPVREALLRLKADGLVVIRRQSGTFVAPIDPALVEEGILVREALEPRVVAVAAERLSPGQIDDLVLETDIMEASIGLPDRSRFIAADDRFHSALITASGHRHIAQIIAQVNAQLDRVRYHSAADPDRARDAVAEHRALIDALRGRDGAAAATLLASHLAHSWAPIRSLVAAF